MFFALGCHLAFSQVNLHVDSWTTAEGLPQNSVRALVRTSDGYLWMGTFEGLARFDGVDFTVFDMVNTPELKSNYVRALIEDKEKNLWIGIDGGGLVKYANGHFRYFSKADGFVSNNVTSLVEDRQGRIWIGAEDGGLSVFENGHFTNFSTVQGLCDENVWAVEEDGEGNIWIGTDSCLSKWRNGKFETLKTDDGLSGNNIKALGKSSGGGVWIGSDGGLDLYQNGNFVRFAAQKDLAGKPVEALWEDNEKNLWIGTIKNGLFRFAVSDQNQAELIGADDEGIEAIYQDADNQLWVGTALNGLRKYQRPRIQTFNDFNSKALGYVGAVYGDSSDRLWFGTPGGLRQIENGVIRDLSLSDKIPGNVRTITEDASGNVWVGGNGIYRYDAGKFTHFTAEDGLSTNFVFSMIGDRAGNVWIGTYDGLNLFKDGKFTVFRKKDGLVDDYILSLFVDRAGAVWIGTREGVSRFQDGKFTNWTTADGLGNNRIFAFYEDRDGAMWIGTSSGGLSRFKDGKLTTISSRDGLYDSLAFAILEDKHGDFWMSGNKGIYRASRAELNDFADGRISSVNSFSYGTEDGMISRECNGANPAGWKTRDGSLWFPTIAGLVKIDTTKQNLAAPSVLIENVQIDGEKQLLSDVLEINPNQENTEIKFTAISWARPKQIKFKYQLEGLDKDWVDVGTRRTAYFSRLPAGEYTFRIIADNGDGVWNTEGKSLKIKVLPPFYRTWWFFALISLAVFFAVYSVFKYRINRVEKARRLQETFSRKLLASQEQERQRIAGELHDTIGQSLLIIKNRVALAQMDIDEKETVEDQLSELSQSAGAAIEECREIAYNLRPYQISRFGLSKTLHGIFMRINEITRIEAAAEIENIDGLLSAEAEINVYRIVQECVNNIIKHSAASVARLEIKRDGAEITMQIKDDGKGFQPTTETAEKRDGGGFGLIGIAERVKMLGGAIEIDSAPGKGTIIKIKFNADLQNNGK